jgi:hypothetical protein
MFAALFLTLFLLPGVFSLTCSEIEATHGLPCVSIPSCENGEGSLVVNQLSNGLGTSKSTAAVNFCYTPTTLNLNVVAKNQVYYPQDVYTACNDNVFLLDVMELFIGSCQNSEECNDNGDTYCYSEIDTSPYNKIFESGIYAPYLNHSSLTNYLIDCDQSQITHQTETRGSEWFWKVSVPWDLINNPQGCPKGEKNLKGAAAGQLFRGNVYRVNAVTSMVTKCSSTSCEYVSWTPTYANPPAFHEPTKFGYFLLV